MEHEPYFYTKTEKKNLDVFREKKSNNRNLAVESPLSKSRNYNVGLENTLFLSLKLTKYS